MEIKKINLLGDSITWGYAPNSGEKLRINYGEILKEKLNLQVLNNYGISGSTLASGENAFEPMCIRYNQMDEDVDMIIVFGGTNDYDPMSQNPIVLGNRGEKNRETVYGALHEICSGLKDKYPNTFIFFITPLKRGYELENGKIVYRMNVKNDLDYSLEDVRNAIKEVCTSDQIDVFDLYEECGINTNQDCLKYLPDGLHPTEEYHCILAEKIIEFINKKYR